MEFFATAEIDRLPLFGDGQYWIEVKRQLNAAETKQMQGLAVRRASKVFGEDGSSDGRVDFDLDMGQAAFEKVVLYLVDWNIPGPDGKAVDITKRIAAKRDALRNMTASAFAEIERVVDAHALAQQEKKLTPPPSIS